MIDYFSDTLTHNWRIKFIILSLVLIPFLSACSETKTAQCQKLILVTKKIAEEGAKNRDVTDMNKILDFAKSFDQASQNVQSFKLADTQLQSYQQDLGDIYDNNAEATRNIVSAIKGKDILTAKLAQEQVKKTGEKEQLLITKMNEYCQSN